MGDWITRQAKTVLVLFTMLTLGLGYFVPDFRVDASAETLLTKDNRLYLRSEVISARFSPDEFILLAFKPKDTPLFSKETFAVLQALSEEIATFERVKSVTSMLNVPLLRAMPGLKGNAEADSWSWQEKRFSPNQMQRLFSDHPLYSDLLVNKAMDATALQIIFKADAHSQTLQQHIAKLYDKKLKGELSEAEERRLSTYKDRLQSLNDALTQQRFNEVEALYQLAEKYRDKGKIYLGGNHVLGYQLIDIIKRDLKLFGSIIAGIIALLLLLLFRAWRWVLIPLSCCGVSVLITMGLFALFGMRTTVISSNFIALQLILTLAVVIHLVVEYRQQAQKAPDASQQQLVSDTINAKIAPCFYAGITTSVGFGSLIFSGIQPVVDFGWMMIVSMAVSICVSLLLFPALLSLYGRSEKPLADGLIAPVLKVLGRLSLRAKGPIMGVSLMVLIVAALGLLRLDVENSFINYFDNHTRVHQELAYIDREFGGSTPLDVIYPVPEGNSKPELLLSAKTIQQLQAIQAVMGQYKAMGNITSVVNFTQLAKEINHNQPLTEYELTALVRLMDKQTRDKLLNSYYHDDTDQLRISARIKDSSEGLDRAAFLSSLKANLGALVPVELIYTNLFVLYQDILSRLFQSQILTLGLVYGVLLLVLLAIFRSISVALIALLPNVITTLLILGLMGWLGIALDLMTITISAIAMGIAVDDTIHFVHRYLKARHQGAEQATADTFASVGYALFYTTVIISLGFGLLSFSDFVPSVIFGALTALAMLTALMADTTLLPALLNRFVARDDKADAD